MNTSDSISEWLAEEMQITTLQPSKNSYFLGWGYKLRFSFLVTCTALAVVGSLLSFIVFIKSRIKHTATGVYLMTLTWLDPLFLVTETLTRTNTLAVSTAWCKLAWYLLNVFRLLEALLVVAICAERMFHFLSPFKSTLYCKVKRALLVVACLTAMSLTTCTYTLDCVILFGEYCTLDSFDPGRRCVLAHFMISIVIAEFIASLLVICMAIYIVKSLRSLGRRATVVSRGKPSLPQVDKEVTRMTTAVAIVFSCFRLPYSLVYIPFYVRHRFYTIHYYENIQVGLEDSVEIFSIPYYMNYCVNFVIYVVFWTAFRRKLLEILRINQKE